ncbi:MAG TPA: hypothetical protein VMS30_11570 [Phycisphaerales bacterium]|nr:hypothetical protein [Phycisphaerales bacterium]
MSVAPHSASESPSPPPHTGETSIAQGYSADASDPQALRRAIELAFDYRGDVTITRRSSPQPIEGYLFDRKNDRAGGGMIVRMIASGSGERIAIPMSDIERIAFTGRDTASGKSFETWVKKYLEKKLAGEKASIESESLD